MYLSELLKKWLFDQLENISKCPLCPSCAFGASGLLEELKYEAKEQSKNFIIPHSNN